MFADQAEAAFRRDQEIANAYHSLNDGKWSGMMAQTHIGYVGWQQPERQTMPQVQRVDGLGLGTADGAEWKPPAGFAAQ